MKIAIGTDMEEHVTNFVVEELKKLGHEVTCFGAYVTKSAPWPKVAVEVAQRVADGAFDQGVLFCWTGTGISLAANKVKGVRAALCNDAETATGARKWNNANVLAMSLRSTSEQVAKEILEAWFSTEPSDDPEDQVCLEYLNRIERERFK